MNNKNKFYLKKLSDKVKKFEILFNSKEDKNNNFNKTLQEFINLQKDNKKIDLNSIYFKEKIDNDFFQNIINKELEFANCTFSKEVYFTDLIFQEKINFEGCTFKEIANFNRAIFKNDCSFENVTFEKEVEFKKTIFKNNAKFSASRFKKFTSFEEAKFNKEADFTNIITEDLFFFYKISLGKLNLIGSYFDKANFLMLHNNDKDDKPLKRENIKNKDTARLLKAHFESENNIIDANIYFALEQEFYLDLLEKENSKYSNRLINKIPILFNKYISNYGTDWLRVLIVLFGFGFFMDFIYTNYSNAYSFCKNLFLLYAFLLSLVVYFYNYFKNSILIFIFIGMIIQFIIFCFIYQIENINFILFTVNEIVKLLNPLNIFKQLQSNKYNYNNYFDILVIVKIIVTALIYQFIISFKNNTRRK